MILINDFFCKNQVILIMIKISDLNQADLNRPTLTYGPTPVGENQFEQKKNKLAIHSGVLGSARGGTYRGARKGPVFHGQPKAQATANLSLATCSQSRPFSAFL